jgi:hypothetical protein
MSNNHSLEELEKMEEDQREKSRVVFAVTILIFGMGALLANWYIIHTAGLYNRFLAFLSPAVVVGAVYSLFFPNDFSDKDKMKFSLRMWAAIFIGLLLCVANLLASEFGFYQS